MPITIESLNQIIEIYSKANSDNGTRVDTVINIQKCLEECNKYIDDRKVNEFNTTPEQYQTTLKMIIGDYVDLERPKVHEFLSQEGIMQYDKLKSHLIKTITGYDVIDDAIKDPSIEEINVNDEKTIYAIRKGKESFLEDEDGNPIQFKDVTTLEVTINNLLRFQGKRLTEGEPLVSSLSKEGHRITASDKSVASQEPGPRDTRSPSVSIRKYGKDTYTFKDLIKWETISTEAANALIVLAKCEQNMLIVGPTGSGKTTTMEIISRYLDPSSRKIIIGNPVETFYVDRDQYGRNKFNVLHWDAKQALTKEEEKTLPTMINLSNHAMRSTPNSILFSEIRSAQEKVNMNEKIQSGHHSMTSAHAGSCAEALISQAQAVQQVYGIDYNSALAQVCNSIDFVIIQEKDNYGKGVKIRRIKEIAEVNGVTSIDGISVIKPNLNVLFRFIAEKENEEDKEDSDNFMKSKVEGALYRISKLTDTKLTKLKNKGVIPKKIPFLAGEINNKEIGDRGTYDPKGVIA